MTKKVATSQEKELYGYVLDQTNAVSAEIVDRVLKSPLDVGGSFFVYGPVNSGKSIIACTLLDVLSKAKSNERKVVCAQPNVQRSDIIDGTIFSRGGLTCSAVSFKSKADIESLFHDYGVVIVDEVQFIPYEMQSFFLKEVSQFVERGGWFIGLSLRFTSVRTEFLLPAVLFDRVNKTFSLTATCLMCGRRGAEWNQRLIDGKSADYQDPELEPPSGRITYEPRCKDCIV
jgi:thymidine kinase